MYISVDIDILDPDYAPATCTPSGELRDAWDRWRETTREFIQILQGLNGVNIFGSDVVEVAPVYALLKQNWQALQPQAW